MNSGTLVRLRATTVATSGWTYAALWALSRAFLGYAWRTTSSFIVGDVNYYYAQVRNAASWSGGLVEYPTPVAWAMKALQVVTNYDPGAFVWGFVTLMVILDALMARLLWTSRTPNRHWAVLAWILFVLFLGPLAYFRFDMAPAVLAGAGALLVNRKPGAAGALIACGGALKLWPALLVLPLLGRGPERRSSAVWFTVTGAALALSSLVVGGWKRLISPLTWQADRGLQIESVAATPLMWARTFTGGEWTVGLSRYNAFEINGPGVTAALGAADVSFVVGFVLILVIGVRAALRRSRTPRTVALVMLTIILIMIVTNKTLSPQYVLWLGGPICVLVATTRTEGPTWYGWVGLFLAATTQQVYPLRYGDLVDGSGAPLGTMFLAVRNAALVVFTVACLGAAWLHTRAARSRLEDTRLQAETIADEIT